MMDFYGDGVTERSGGKAPHPTDALLFHGVNGAHFVTHHPIEKVKGAHALGAGRALRTEDARRLLEKLLGVAKEGAAVEMIPPNVLVRDPLMEAWFVPGTMRPMHFRMREGGFKGVLQVMWPTLLFVASRHDLRIAALASASRPDANTALFHAPLMNIFGDGRVCRASEDAGVSPLSQGRAWCEDAVFKTAFSHVNHGALLAGGGNATDTAMLRFWKPRNRKAKEVIKAKHMRPLRRTVEQFLSRSAS